LWKFDKCENLMIEVKFLELRSLVLMKSEWLNDTLVTGGKSGKDLLDLSTKNVDNW